MADRASAMVTQDEVQAAVARVLLERNVLLEKVLTDPAPSVPMMRRILKFAQSV